MKRIIFTIVFLTILSPVRGQMVVEGGLNGVLVETRTSPVLEKIEGSPYFKNDFQRGEMQIEGKQALQVYLRYDVSNETMEIKTDLNEKQIYKLSPALKARYQIGDDIFVYDQMKYGGENYNGFFKRIYQGKVFTLLEKPVIKIKEAQKAKSGYEEDKPAQISVESEYFIVGEKGKVYNVRIKHRDIKKIFQSNEAKKYLSNNKIRTLEDLKKFIKYLEQ